MKTRLANSVYLRTRKILKYIALLKLEHIKETKDVESKISNEETELERKNKEITQQVTIASLKSEISKMKADNAIKEGMLL